MSCSNTITDNTFSDNDKGIDFFEDSNDNVASRNMIVGNVYGIALFSRSNNNVVSENIITDNKKGIYLVVDCVDNIILGNTITNNGNGIYLKSFSSENTISDNTIANNSCGMSFEGSNSNTIFGNTITNSSEYGIRLIIEDVYWEQHWSNDNLIYHNSFINNIEQAYDECLNTWDNGYPSGGNYWNDFDEPSEGAYDNNSDGIADSPYNITGGDNQDRYPFIRQNGWMNNPPYSPSNPDPQNGATNVSIDADLSWDCGDSDGDPVTYDVYFGYTTPPPQVAWNHTDTTYILDTLDYETRYFWKIVAWDNHSASTEGAIWSFITVEDITPPTGEITKPEKAVYIKDKKIMPFPIVLIIGNINIEVEASDDISGINRVEFYIDDILKGSDMTAPYSLIWKERVFFRHTIKVVTFDNSGNNATEEMLVWKFF